MPGLGDIRGHVKRGLKLKPKPMPKTSNSQSKLPREPTLSDVAVEVGSLYDPNNQQRRVEKQGKYSVVEQNDDQHEEGFKYQSTELFHSFGQVVMLLVGHKAVILMAHKDLLCNNSPFFFAACKRAWIRKNLIRLPDDDPAAVTIMLYWLYHKRLGVPEQMFHKDELVKIHSGMNSAPGLLAKLYVMANKYKMPALMNDTVNALMYWHSEHSESSKIPAKVIRYLFEILPNSESSAFNQFINYLVDLQYEASDFDLAKPYLPFEFLFQYYKNTSLMKIKRPVEAKLQGGASISTLLAKGLGPQGTELKQYVLIKEKRVED